jgi:hypothetical protein
MVVEISGKVDVADRLTEALPLEEGKCLLGRRRGRDDGFDGTPSSFTRLSVPGMAGERNFKAAIRAGQG